MKQGVAVEPGSISLFYLFYLIHFHPLGWSLTCLETLGLHGEVRKPLR